MTSTLTSDVQQRLTGTALGGGAQAGPSGTIPVPSLQGWMGVGLLAGPSGVGGARGERACVCPLWQTRQYIQRWLKPGMKMIDICEHLEGVARQLVEENGLKSGGGGAGGGAQVRWGRGSGKLVVGLKSDVWGSSQMGMKLGWVRLKSVGVGLKSGGDGAGGGAQVRWGPGLEQEGVVLGFKLGGLLLFALPDP